MRHARLCLMLSASLTLLAAGCAKEDAADAAPSSAAAPSGETTDADEPKTALALEDVPAEAVAAARTAAPGVTLIGAERETRRGKPYYDIEGELPDGSEIEFDVTEIDGAWTVVEIQRDIVESETPETVLAVLRAERPGFAIVRIIESRQRDGVIIYEFYRESEGGAREKAEVKLEDGAAEFLDEEWEH